MSRGRAESINILLLDRREVHPAGAWLEYIVLRLLMSGSEER